VGWLFPDSLIPSCYYQGIGLIMALGVPAFFQAKLGGQTGDTYGAIVEWTETLSLVGMAMIQSHL
jgi:adenosylcobinamide-GDP ribazoletransferase